MNFFLNKILNLKNAINLTGIFLCLIIEVCSAKNTYASLHRGLYFYSHESPIENRTSLILNNKEAYALNNKDIFCIEFDLHVRTKENIRFGYILKMISDKKESYNLLLNNYNDLYFVVDKQGKKEEFKKINLDNEDHLKIKIVFDKAQNQVTLKINTQKITYKNDLSYINSLIINFGKCEIKGFESNDVPPMTLGNIIVKKNGKTLNHWLFDKYATHIIYDSVEQKEAWFNQGKMLIDNSIHWQKIGSIKAHTTPQISFDSLHNQLLVLDTDQEISFSISNGEVNYLPMKNIPFDLLVNRFIYDYSSNRLLSYNFNPARLNYFDAKTNSWGKPIEESHEFSHHNRYLSLKDSTLYLYGGYGHYRYKGILFKVNLKTGKWFQKDLSAFITPRYLAAMGGSKNSGEFYILGGKGAEMGMQELSPKNFFDLYQVDLNTLKPKLLYRNGEEEKKNLAFSNSLIVDDDNKFIYVLAYPIDKTDSYFQLKKIGINNPSVESYADSVKFYFKDDLSYCDLFFSPSLSKLIAVVAHSKDRIHSTIEVYTLDFPPLKVTDLYEMPTKKSYWWLIAAIPLAVILVFLYKNTNILKKNNNRNAVKDTNDKQALEQPIIKTNFTNKFYKHNISSILFLGEFQIFDKNGKEITEGFSPTLKYLLVLLIFYSTKNEKGISSTKLEEILWFGKSEKSAINNRNVNISKLRILLESFGDIEILNKNTNWSIVLPEDVLVDYVEILNLSKQIKDNINYDKESVYRFLELLSYGELLPNIQYEWIDSFKSDFANLMVDTLLFIIKTKNTTIEGDVDTLLRITDTIFIFDPISEEAITMKCKILYDSGKKALAKSTYENFSKRYSSLLGEDFNKSLKDIIE